MSIIRKKWSKWVSIPLAAVLVLGTILGVQMTLEPSPASASGVAATNVILTGQNTTDNYTFVQFDIDWGYSWRDATNWDAAWVFVKYQAADSSEWKHATLSPADEDHSVTTNNGVAATIDAASDATGVFMHRTDNGTGSINWDGVKLAWSYGIDGLADDAIVKVKVFAIEMVYIPGGVSFNIGDGNGTSESANAFHTGTTGNTTVTISSGMASDIHVDTNSYDDAVIETGTGIGIDGDGGLDVDDDGAIDNADFPTGYNAFYVMKYEISQRQYAEFLNTLTSAQAGNRIEDHFNDYRNYIQKGNDTPATYGCDASNTGGTWGNVDPSGFNGGTDGEWIACNYLSWMDGAAYADWAGLRPMTELEFEKISRGPTAAVYAEYAWGSTSITQATGISDANQDSETSSNAANAVYGNHASVQGPLRNGALTDLDDSRVEAGASYYGVMEMSGNLWERSVTVGNPTGRGFGGSHGDGELNSSGNANVDYWPGTDAVGSGFRGGEWYNGESYLRVSDRGYAAFTYTARYGAYGFRLVRTS